MTSDLVEARLARAAKVRAVVPVALIVVLLAIVFLQWAPQHFHSFSAFDSGIFLYVGQQLRQGHHLYRNVWDHKPPLIFLFNEIGLMLDGGSPAGVLVLDYLFSLAFFLVAYKELRHIFGEAIALLAILLGILFLRDITPQPNLGEVVSLPFQVAAFLLLSRDLDHGVSLVRDASQGVLLALLFWTRPDGIAISVIYCAVTLVHLVRECKPIVLARWAAVFFIALSIASAIIVVPFALGASWDEVWFATFTFNEFYANLTTAGERIRSLWWMIQYTSQHGFILLAVAGVVLILLRPRWNSTRSRVLVIVTVWFCLELFFAAYTGKQYGKNMIPILFPAMFGIAVFFHRFVETSSQVKTALLPVGIASAIVFCFTGALAASQFRENARARPDADAALISEVQKLSAPAERVTFWGVFAPRTIFAVHRSSGTRFFSSVPLSHGESLYRVLAPRAVDDLERSQPKFIVQRNDGQIPPLAEQPIAVDGHVGWDTTALTEEKVALMRSYALVWSDPETKTVIYERR